MALSKFSFLVKAMIGTIESQSFGFSFVDGVGDHLKLIEILTVFLCFFFFFLGRLFVYFVRLGNIGYDYY
jgi:hypothetical protein